MGKDPSGFHTRYYPDRDLGRVELLKRAIPTPVERLTFEIAEAAGGGGMISILWEGTEASIRFRVECVSP